MFSDRRPITGPSEYLGRKQSATLPLLAILLVICGCSGDQREDQRPTEFVHDTAAEREFSAFVAQHEEALRSALIAAGVRLDSLDGVGHHVYQATPEDVLAGLANASISMFVKTNERQFGDDVWLPAFVTLEFRRLEQGGPWLLLTEDGYLYSMLGEESEKDQDLPPRAHVGIQEAFPQIIDVHDYYAWMRAAESGATTDGP